MQPVTQCSNKGTGWIQFQGTGQLGSYLALPLQVQQLIFSETWYLFTQFKNVHMSTYHITLEIKL